MFDRQSRKLPAILGYKPYFFTILQICVVAWLCVQTMHAYTHACIY